MPPELTGTGWYSAGVLPGTSRRGPDPSDGVTAEHTLSHDGVQLPLAQDPVASIIVVGWRSSPRLLDCLRSLATNVRHVPYEVVVVLNVPSPERWSELERLVAGATVVRSTLNLGFPAACNLGVERSRAPLVVLLNDDCEVEPGWLDPLVETATTHTEAGAVGSRLLSPDGSLEEAGGLVWSDGTVTMVGHDAPRGSAAFDQQRVVHYCSAASLLVRRSSWDAVGGFEEAYFPGYYEDVDLCFKIAARGQDVLYEPRSVVRHHRGSSTHPIYRQFLAQRNRQHFVERWHEILEQLPAPPPQGTAALEEIEEAVRQAAGDARVAKIAEKAHTPATTARHWRPRSARHRRPRLPRAARGSSHDDDAGQVTTYEPPEPGRYLGAELAAREGYLGIVEEKLERSEARVAELSIERTLLKEHEGTLREAIRSIEAQRDSLLEAHDNYARAYRELETGTATLRRELDDARQRLASRPHRVIDAWERRLEGHPALARALRRLAGHLGRQTH